MAAVDPFPLLNLPKDALRCVITQMRIHLIFGISLTSQKAKRLIEAVELISYEEENVFVNVNACIEVDLIFPDLGTFKIQFDAPENVLTGELYEPTGFVFSWINKNGQLRWTNLRSLTIEDVIDRIKSIFHRKYVILVFEANSDRYSPALISEMVGNFESIQLPSDNHDYNQRVLSALMPSQLDMNGNALHNSRVPEKFSFKTLIH